MLTIVAAILLLLALAALITRPQLGVACIFLVRPIVDATWAVPVVGDLTLPQLMGVLVPAIVIGHMTLTARGDARFAHMPLRWVWLTLTCYAVCFSVLMAFVSSWLDAAEVLFRHLSGIVGFFMMQAYFRRTEDIRRLMLAIAVAGAFPMAVGLYQQVTGVQWAQAQAEGLTRLVGLYHDAFTVRYLMLQTLLALLLYLALLPRVDALRATVAGGYALGALAVLFRAYSKSGTLTLALWALTWTVLRRHFGLLVVLGALVLLASVYFVRDIAAQIAQLFVKELTAIAGEGDVMRTFAGRWFDWSKLVDEWRSLGAFEQVFGSGRKATGAHNDYLLMLFHGGLIGLGIYLTLLGAVLVKGLRNVAGRPRPLDVAALMVLCLWLVDTVGLVPSAYPAYQWFVWGIVGLAFRLHGERADEAVATATAPPRPLFRGQRAAPTWHTVAGHR
jgi:hypothetical protein